MNNSVSSPQSTPQEISYSTLNFHLGEEINMLRQSVYQWAQHELAPLAADIDHSNNFPEGMWQKMGAMGLLGITVSEQYGGAGMGYLAHVVAMEEISRASATTPFRFGRCSKVPPPPWPSRIHNPFRSNTLALFVTF